MGKKVVIVGKGPSAEIEEALKLHLQNKIEVVDTVKDKEVEKLTLSQTKEVEERILIQRHANIPEYPETRAERRKKARNKKTHGK